MVSECHWECEETMVIDLSASCSLGSLSACPVSWDDTPPWSTREIDALSPADSWQPQPYPFKPFVDL